jgi:hypothetical protein
MVQVERILASKGFSGSDPTRQMLLYLASRSFEHPGEAVKEFELATSALGKGAEYDPRTDSTVRVAASRLRAKLAEYYAQDGAADPVVISVPKGSYYLASARQPAGTAATAPKGLSAPVPSVSNGTRRLFLSVGASGLAGALAGVLIGRRSAIRDFWREFVKDGAPIVIYSNPRFVGRVETGMRLAEPSSAAEGPMNWLYTGVGEVMAVRQLSEQLGALGIEPRVKRARLFTWDDARSSDLIFVGGQEQNLPMAQLPRLEKFNLKPEVEEPFPNHGGVVNEMPAAGEETFYMSSDDPENGVEYAVIALTRGIVQKKRVLVLAGVRTLGTEAAAAAVCNPVLLGDLLHLLGAEGASTMPLFEALIEVQVRGGAPLEARLRLVYKRLERPNAK